MFNVVTPFKSAPEGLRALYKNDKLAFISWQKIDTSGLSNSYDELIQGYTILIGGLTNSISKTVDDAGTTELYLTELDLGATYSIKVASYNKAGTGAYSSEIIFKFAPCAGNEV